MAHRSARSTQRRRKPNRPTPMRVWNRAVRKCWRSAGPCSRPRWDGTMYSLTMVGTRSSSRDWRSACRKQDGRCRSGRYSLTATRHERWPIARGSSSRPPRPPRLPRNPTEAAPSAMRQRQGALRGIFHHSAGPVPVVAVLPPLDRLSGAHRLRGNRRVLHDRVTSGSSLASAS